MKIDYKSSKINKKQKIPKNISQYFKINGFYSSIDTDVIFLDVEQSFRSLKTRKRGNY